MTRPPIRARFRFAERVVFLLALVSLASSAYQQRLDSESIREAYFLGQRRDEVTAHFLASYFHSFPLPKTGPHIAQVEALTPYAQVVLNPGRGTIIDAEAEYDAQPSLFLVDVKIYSTPTYSLPSQCADVMREFAIRVVQGRPLSPEKKTCLYLHSTPGTRPSSGAELELYFDTAQVASEPITIDVSSPDGQHVEAKFDLSKLK